MTPSTAYVDSSVLLRWLLKQPGAVLDWGKWSRAVTSDLTRVESFRRLDRMRLRGILSDLHLGRTATLLRSAIAEIEQARISEAILERAAGPFPTELATLDAIHLATALLWVQEKGESLTFLTHDRQLAIAAAACGLETGPEPICGFANRENLVRIDIF